jgi:hypothetical protein
MRQDVENYVSVCDDCHRNKQSREYIAPLGEVRQPTYPFEITSMDICGPYPLTLERTIVKPTTLTNGIMTKEQRSDSLDQVKLFICSILLDNPVKVPNFSLLGKDLTRSQLAYPS